MKEITLLNPGPCEEAMVAFLETIGVSPAVKLGFGGASEAIVFYMEEEPWEMFREVLRERLKEISRIFRTSPPEVSVRCIETSEWRDAWRRYARIYRFGRELVVKPSWRVLRVPPTCPVISIDPQMAFGTGGHASTRLCLRHLLRIQRDAPDRFREVLDVGTGSGILSIAAVLLGARRCVAVDIDSEALSVARQNAEKNGVMSSIEFRDGGITGVTERFDLILANINEAVLSGLLQDLVSRMRTGGVLVVSGILRDQGQAFLKKASRAGLKQQSRRVEREWISYALTLRRSRT